MKLLEIEIKAFCDDPGRVREAIKARGGIERKRVVEEDTYYNHPARDFAETDEALRIRNAQGRQVLTYKGPKLSSRSKARIEEEVDISKNGNMHEVLVHLGFRESGRVIKQRELYRLDDMDITIDEVRGLGTFVELEKKGTSIDKIEPQLFAMAEKLGLSRFERRSYLEMLLEKQSPQPPVGE